MDNRTMVRGAFLSFSTSQTAVTEMHVYDFRFLCIVYANVLCYALCASRVSYKSGQRVPPSHLCSLPPQKFLGRPLQYYFPCPKTYNLSPHSKHNSRLRLHSDLPMLSLCQTTLLFNIVLLLFEFLWSPGGPAAESCTLIAVDRVRFSNGELIQPLS